MAIYTGGIRQMQEAKAASTRIAEQQASAQAAEDKRKGRSGLFGKMLKTPGQIDKIEAGGKY